MGTFQTREQARQVGAQRDDVDTHACWSIGLEQGEAGAQLGQGAEPVAAPEVIEPDTGEQDTLIEIPYGIGLDPPERFERFVALPVVTTVELGDALQ